MSPEGEQKELLGEIREINNEWLNEFSTPLIDAKKLAGDSDSSLLSFNRLYREKLTTGNERYMNRQLQERIRLFINNEYNSRDIRTEILDASVRRTRGISIGLASLSIM